MQFLVVVIVPVVFWTAYFCYKDRLKPEPPSRLALAYLLGLGSAFVAQGAYFLIDRTGLFADPVEMIFSDRVGFFTYAFLVIGPLEEASKLVFFLVVCARLRDFDEKIDGMVYASMIALGFASIENVYLLEILSGWQLYLRAIAAPVVHASFASIWGLVYAAARMNRKNTTLRTGIAFVVAAALHGLYDYLATWPAMAFSSAGVILILWGAGIYMMHRFQSKTPEASGRNDSG
ncbi:MAG: PrsW family intramembrane metalloprotease [Deltaproteobacteria bacterium]|nr:PrsW family intramembrane metalloprotease [Deltaproteobacteria bacterium]